MRASRWLITFAYAGAIFYLSSRTWAGAELFPHSDKVIHFCVYFVLGMLCVWSLRGTSLRERYVLMPLAALMATIYGITDELHQSFVPGRMADIFDLLADALGAFAGAALMVWIARRYRGRSHES